MPDIRHRLVAVRMVAHDVDDLSGGAGHAAP
jgi:hypothetical protein